MLVEKKGAFVNTAVFEEDIKNVNLKTGKIEFQTETHSILISDNEIKKLIAEIKKNPIRMMMLIK